jgi:feruloyl-CoA synthase
MGVRSAPYRPISLATGGAPIVRRGSDGSIYVKAGDTLGTFPMRLTDRVEHWAKERPEEPCVAERDPTGEWRFVSYRQMDLRMRQLGGALVRRNLSAERPLMVLSGNDIAQLELTLGAMWAGIPIAPVSPAYSLVSSDFGKLRYLVELMTPGAVFVNRTAPFRAALAAVFPADVELITGDAEPVAPGSTSLAVLYETGPNEADAAHANVTGDTIAKFLFTSGSTKLPKAVPNTQQMLCSNQEMLLHMFPFLAEEPPVLVDWLPWHHTFGGNHNVGMVLYNGGTLYIDTGKPTPALIEETLRNLRDVAPTAYFNVPKGWEDIANAMRTDPKLRETFFSRVKLLFYAGAGLAQPVWDTIDELAVATCGARIRMMGGLGMTETAPSAMFSRAELSVAGDVGLPCPGCEVKLAPVDKKLELRFRGPNVMGGYWRAPELMPETFDEEGFLKTGDALRPHDEQHLERGFAFDGRLAEDFKLSSGTFVSVGPLRAALIASGAPCVQDVVLAGVNRDRVAALIIPRADQCIKLATGSPSGEDARGQDLSLQAALSSQPVKAHFLEALKRVNRSSTGSASRIEVAVVLAEPPSLDRGEITDKGSINQRAVLQQRQALVDSIYLGTAPDMIVVPKQKPEEAVERN